MTPDRRLVASADAPETISSSRRTRRWADLYARLPPERRVLPAEDVARLTAAKQARQILRMRVRPSSPAAPT